ncbi:35630_t:CDS:1, partial [Racocetra persica]
QPPQPTNQGPKQPTNPENTPIIPPQTIQENYNNDKEKSTIENNSNSTTPEQKEQSKELLRLIIEAELLIKDNQFNDETLSKLIQEKEQNTEAYQLLKERIEQVINELSSLQQSQNKNNESVANNNKSDISPIKIFTIIGIIGVIIMSSLV